MRVVNEEFSIGGHCITPSVRTLGRIFALGQQRYRGVFTNCMVKQRPIYHRVCRRAVQKATGSSTLTFIAVISTPSQKILIVTGTYRPRHRRHTASTGKKGSQKNNAPVLDLSHTSPTKYADFWI
jgi:hypothetical protein